jgi:glutathione S-transferase
VGEAMSLADIALYAYTHVAGGGGFDLVRYPAITAWIDRAFGAWPHHDRRLTPTGSRVS